MGTSGKVPLSVPRHWPGWHLSVILILLLSGCLTTTSRSTSVQEARQPAAVASKTRTAGPKKQELRKPRPAADRHETTEKQKGSAPSAPKDATHKRKMGPDAALKKRLESEATELAKNIGSVRKVKLCYDKKTDEWWLTLYKELSTAMDVKQFFWSWEREEFTPFLVIKRISKGKLMDDLKKNGSGRTCSELPAPPLDPNDPFVKFWGRSLDFESR